MQCPTKRIDACNNDFLVTWHSTCKNSMRKGSLALPVVSMWVPGQTVTWCMLPVHKLFAEKVMEP